MAEPAEPAAPAPARLPRGRHGLSREEIARTQRERMLLSLAEAMTRSGYVGTTVADVIKGAGVSRETFYQQFPSKLDCFTAAFDTAAELLLARMAAGTDAAAATDPVDRVAVFADLLHRYLDAIADDRAFARVFLVEVYAAGPEALTRRLAVQQRIVDGLAELLGDGSPRDRFACEVLVAATASMVTVPLVADDPDAIRALHAPLVDLVTRALGR